MHAQHDHAKGILYGISAGAFWGLIFLAPKMAGDFNPLQLTVGRFLVYGVAAAALLWPHRKRLAQHLGRSEWAALFRLGLLCNILQFVLLAAAVQLGGVAMTSLIIGFLPVAVTVIGSRDHGAVSLRSLAPSLLLSTAGVLCISWETLSGMRGDDLAKQALGLFCAFGALASWATFAVGNSRWLARVQGITAHEWGLLIGVATGVQALALVPFAFLLGMDGHTGGEWMRFAAVCLGITLFSSILGISLWNRMSQLLPLTMVGQMILFETLFALLYGFAWDQRLPVPMEVLAMGFVIASVLSSVSAHRGKVPQTSA